jgi:hypothetical protein
MYEPRDFPHVLSFVASAPVSSSDFVESPLVSDSVLSLEDYS